MIKVSIIVPVYNTSKYLDKCISSLINQTLKDIEIIIVNDGSIDDSQKKIELWQKKDKRIKLYNKENGGQASARNLGLSVAKGEYIAFLDSDDYVADEMYYLLYQEAKNNDFDIVLCDYYLDYGNKILKSNQLSTKTSIMSANDYILSTPSPVNKLIKRTFLKENNFSFPEGFIYEDLAAMPILGIYNPTIKYINKYLYYYVQTPVSTMRNDEYKEKYEDIFKAIEYLYNNMIDKDYNQELEYLLTYHFLYLGSLNFFKYKKYENINKISKIMHECFPYWSKNKFVTSKLTKKQILYMKLFYYKKYFLINFYRRLLTKNEQN